MIVGIIPAGGTGERLGADRPKALVVCRGRPLLDWSLDVLDTVCDRVVVALPEGHEGGADRVPGGPSRSQSVRNAVQAAPEATAFVVHDAARPLVTGALVRACLEGLADADAAIAAAPVTDTIKEADDGRIVTRTLERSALWSIQTPQAFRAEILRDALDVPAEVLAAATDDASLVEAAGGVVRVVEAPPENLKVTTPLDLRVAETLLAERC